MTKTVMRGSMVVVMVAFMLLGIMFLAGCNSVEESNNDDMNISVDESNIDMYEVDRDIVAETGSGGFCLVRDDKCYSMMALISREKAEEYGVGDWYNERGAWIYLHTYLPEIISLGDFDPIVASSSDKIVSYSGKINIVPVEFKQYTFRGLVYNDSVVYYPYDDSREDEEATDYNNLSIYNSQNESVSFSDFIKDEQYTIKWDDDDGHHEMLVVSSNRLYEVGEPIDNIEGKDEGEYIEYDISSLPPGLYTIIPEGTNYQNAATGIFEIK